MSTAVTHDAVVAGERPIADCVEYAEFISQSPCLLLVAPHKGRVQAELFTKSQIECNIQTLDKTIATIRVATEVCLPNTCNDVEDAVITGIDGSNREEEEVTPRYECSGVGIILPFFLLDVEYGVCQTA